LERILCVLESHPLLNQAEILEKPHTMRVDRKTSRSTAYIITNLAVLLTRGRRVVAPLSRQPADLTP
jgi:hypothetical protein